MKVRWTPLLTTARAQIELFTFQCRKSEPIGNGQLIRTYKEIPVHIETYRYQRQMTPPSIKHRGLAYLCIKSDFFLDLVQCIYG